MKRLHPATTAASAAAAPSPPSPPPPPPSPLLLLLLLLPLLAARVSAADFDVRAFGGVGDGRTMNTAPFRAAVAAAHASWAATGAAASVVVAEGVYVTGCVALLSGVHLRVDAGATLLASNDASQFPAGGGAGSWGVVFAEGARDVGVFGGGTLDGNWSAYVGAWDARNVEYVPRGWDGACAGNSTSDCRPMLAKFVGCSDVTVADVALVGSPFWTLHLLNCSTVAVRNVTQRGDERFPNNDGIDIDSSQHVLVSDSTFDTADDGVCIKSTPGCLDTFNVTVRNVTVRSRSSAVKIGSATPVDIHDLLFEDVRVHDSNGGLSIQARDGGTVSNVAFRNILVNGTRQWPGIANASGAEFGGWWGSGENIWISTVPRTETSPRGLVRNISYENIVGVGQNANFISGRAPGNAVSGVTLRNVTLTIDRWPWWNFSHPDHDYRPTSALPLDLQPAPTDALFVEAVEGLVLEGVTLRFARANAQPYWTRVCVNASAAGFPVREEGVTCDTF